MIVVGGENLIDLVGAEAAGDAPAYIPHPGGSPFNVAMAAGRQDAAVAYLTPISSDMFGDMLAARLKDAGVALAGGRSDKPTSLAVVTLDNGIPTYAFYRSDTAERQVDGVFIDKSMPEEVRIFHIGSNALIDGGDADAWEAAFSEAKKKGILTSMDPNIRASLVTDGDAHRTRIKRMMKSADIFKASDEDMEWLYPGLSVDAMREACRGEAPGAAVVITAGGDGSWASSGGREFSTPAWPVPELADTVGAGDTFMASLLVWCSENGGTRDAMVEALGSAGFEQAVRRSAAAAALNCGHHGCVPPNAGEIDAALGTRPESTA